MKRLRINLVTTYQPRIVKGDKVWLKLSLTESKGLVVAKTRKVDDKLQYQLNTEKGESYGGGVWYLRTQLSKR